MCGLAGLFDVHGLRPYPPELIRAMTDAIAHRGPDGDGFFHDPGLTLGHRRLSIIDLAGGTQPMSLPDESVTLVQNGEIYNYKELRPQLEAKGAVFRTNSDTETLLHAWRAWGPDMVRHLRGMFAFAIWDRGEQTLFLARDRLGKKPLHYAMLANGTLAFASEIKALLVHPEVNRELDRLAVEDYFAYGYIPDPRTIYSSIKKLPPAHTLMLKRGGAPVLHRYWDLAEASACIDRGDLTAEALVARLEEAVKYRLVADVEVGAFLSGGVDSSAVVALMARNSSAVSTFSIGLGEKQFDESAYAERVAARYHTRHQSRLVAPDSLSLLSQLPQIFDEPFGDSSAIPTYYVCAETSRFLKVCLSGDGGDEALAGYRRHAFHMAEERVRAVLPSPLRRAMFGLACAAYPKLDWAPRWMRAKTTLHELSLDSATAYFQILSALPDKARRSLYSPDFTSALGGYDPKEIVARHYSAAADLDPLQRAQYVDANVYLSGDILVKVDRTSMANSLEVRAPFLDHEFMSWAFALPPHLKIAGGQGKAILKRAMEPFLPHDLLYRPKQGFTVPLAQWLRGPLKGLAQNLSGSEVLRSAGMFDMAEIGSRVSAHLSGAQDHTKSLWLLLVFEGFLKHCAFVPPSSIGRSRGEPRSSRPVELAAARS
jgi:asparagine synthase (glutamine-hydrolysing)